MQWSDLRIFLAIARSGTLGGAARELGQTQPTMGRRLRALEASLGHTLFQRTAKGLVLTDEGATVLAHAERMETETIAFQRRLAGEDHQLEGTLRLTASEWFSACLLAPVLAEFSAAHPSVTVELLTDARLYSLPRREADLAFRISAFDEPEVVSRRLLHVDYALYSAQDLPPPDPGDGSGACLITMNAAFAQMPDALWLRKLLPKARVVHRSNNREVQARLCALGLGFAVLPRPLGDAYSDLKSVDLGSAPPGRDTWVGYHRDMRRLPRLRAMLDLVIKRLADQGA